MNYTTILIEKTDAIATLTLNRAEARNALDLTMREEIVSALDGLEVDEAIRVLIIRGAGEHFCGGADVKGMKEKRRSAAEGRARVELLNRMVRRIVSFPRPTIAMVDGFAVGAGCHLALCADLIVASERARFGEVFTRIGLVPDGGGNYFLPRLVGLAKAKELVFTAEIIDAAEAFRIGLVNRVVPAAELSRTTVALAQKLAAGPPRALALAKDVLNRAASSDLQATLNLEAFAQAVAMTTEDHQEGLAAFFEKRPPQFTGR